MPSTPSPKLNHLLAALPLPAFWRLVPHLEYMEMPIDYTLYEADIVPICVYFPTTCIVSLFCVVEDGGDTAVAVVGNEGMVGVSLIMGGEMTIGRAVVQVPGGAYRLKASVLKEEFALSDHLQRLVLRYTQALITQMGQTAVCNRHHNMEQQLCRCLLLALDRTQGNKLEMIHSRMARMLGIRRETVSEAAGILRDAGLIQYSRGLIAVLDRAGLEARVCECYGVVKQEYDRLLPGSERRQD